MSTNVILSSNFDPKTVVFSGVEKTKKGGKIVYLGTGSTGKERIVIQTPPMPMPFGITPYQEASTGDIQSYSIDVSFRTAETDPRVASFAFKLRELDEMLIEAGTKHSQEWFGKKMTKELVGEFYRKLLKENPNYPPILKIKVAVDSHGEPSAQFFDENRAPVSIDYLVKGSTVKMICELSSVWFVNKTFGATFRLVQAAVVSKPKRLSGYSFADEDDGPAAGDDAAAGEPEQAMEM